MKRKLVTVIIALLLVVGGVIVVKSKQKSLANLPKPKEPLPTVQVMPIRQGTLDVSAHYLGSIEPFTRSDLSARISGNILAITKREGDSVRQGEVIITIDDRELLDRSIAVNAEVLATKQRLAGAKSAYETQKSVYERDVILYKAGAISQEALERSRAALDGAKATVDAYEESMKGFAMNTSVARTQAGYARITAPFSGVVSKRWADPGDLAVPGKPILTIEKTSPYKVLAQVPQEELTGIRPGTPVKLTNGDQEVSAKVNRVYPALGKSMLATVEVLTKTAPFDLPSASTVGFDLVTKQIEGLIVPDQAVVKTDKGASVYQVKDGLVHIVPVTLLGMGNGKAAISGDVPPAAQVAVAQENKLLTLTEGGGVIPAEQGKSGERKSGSAGGKQ
ncbi:MAG: efflux RND transporter periplasmic adaptor subunit [Nitrospiraceae bacterium]|nr:efflux RND transporter periplasmic adaptor subunit [Nitrospiraceae bacterium]